MLWLTLAEERRSALWGAFVKQAIASGKTHKQTLTATLAAPEIGHSFSLACKLVLTPSERHQERCVRTTQELDKSDAVDATGQRAYHMLRMSNLIVWHDGDCPLCPAEIALMLVRPALQRVLRRFLPS